MIIKSLCDLDLYKITMGQFAFHQYPDSVVSYEFKCRNKDVDLTPYRTDIEMEINELAKLRFTDSELKYLSQLKNGEIFKPDFINYLSKFKLDPENQVKCVNDNGELKISVKGKWVETILFETLILSIVNEIYFRYIQPDADFLFGLTKLEKKVDLMKQSVIPFKFMEFGTRRRYSQKWQETVVSYLKKHASHYLIGTSNVDLARRLDIPVRGTFAHETLQFHQSLDPKGSYFTSQRQTLDNWHKEYGHNLLIALSDIFGTDSFLKDITVDQAKLYDGFRQDSGDPIVWVDKVIKYYKQNGIDPLTKMALFSDGLDIEKALKINEYCLNKIQCSFGVGTNLSNDLGFKALNIVMKMVEANVVPVVKISDEPSKAIGNSDVIKKIKTYYNIGE